VTSDRTPLYDEDILGRHPGGEPRGLSRVGSSIGMVVDTWRRRPGPRRFLTFLSVLLLLGGVVLFAWPFLTNVYTGYRQSTLEEELLSEESRRAYVTRTIQPGEALTRILIPKLGLDTIVVEGTTLSALQAGAGHYADTALPCEEGNAGIAGHRTTYGKPFAEVDDLRKGDRITLETPVGRCTYEVTTTPFVTTPTDFDVLDQGRGSELTLTTCHPPGSNSQRLIVKAELVSSKIFEN
jgi:sortase A